MGYSIDYLIWTNVLNVRYAIMLVLCSFQLMRYYISRIVENVLLLVLRVHLVFRFHVEKIVRHSAIHEFFGYMFKATFSVEFY